MELQASWNMPSKDEINVVRCAGNVVGEKDFASFGLLRRKRGEPSGGLWINLRTRYSHSGGYAILGLGLRLIY